MLIREVNQKSAIICNGCHDALMISMNLSNIAILNIHDADYRCTFSRISKSEGIKLMQNIDLTKKEEHFETLKLFIANKNGLRNFNVW